MTIFDLFQLRPTAPTAASIREALTRATVAEQEQSAALHRARAERDRLLLDGTAAALSKAETALTAAAEPAERVASIRRQLEGRLAAALEAETVAAVEEARKQAEAASARLSGWWLGIRETLAQELTEGLRLKEAASVAYGDWTRATRQAGEAYPRVTFTLPAANPDEVGQWMSELHDAVVQQNFEHLASFPRPARPLVRAQG